MKQRAEAPGPFGAALLHPIAAREASLPAGGGEAEDLRRDGARRQGIAKYAYGTRRRPDRRAEHRAGLVDQQADREVPGIGDGTTQHAGKLAGGFLRRIETAQVCAIAGPLPAVVHPALGMVAAGLRQARRNLGRSDLEIMAPGEDPIWLVLRAIVGHGLYLTTRMPAIPDDQPRHNRQQKSAGEHRRQHPIHCPLPNVVDAAAPVVSNRPWLHRARPGLVQGRSAESKTRSG